jgi:erythromycin esterase
MGFTAIAMETGFTEAIAADEYVLGRGDLSREVIRSGFSWSNNPTTSNRQLFEWIRAHNARPTTKRPVHLYGFDPAGARLGKFPYARMAADAAIDYAASVEPEAATDLKSRLAPLLPKFSTDDYASLSADERSVLALGLQDLVVLFERRHPEWVAATSALAYFRAHRNAVIARHLDANFRVGAGKSPQVQRGAIQIDNLRAIVEREGPQGRLLVFAHNTHVKKAPSESGRTSLGRRLAALFGDQLTVIGSTYHEGAVGYAGIEVTDMPAETGTLNAVLAGAVNRPLYALDLRTLPAKGPMREWFATGTALRHGYFEGDPSKSFDALVFVRTIGPLRPIP